MLITLWSCAGFALAMCLLAFAIYKVASRGHWQLLRVLALLALLASLPGFGVAGYLGYRLADGQPQPRDTQLAEGVRYERIVMQEPRPIVAHLLTIDLTLGHRFVVTPPSDTPDGPRSPATTATDALGTLDADLVINGSFFRPFQDRWFMDYSPTPGGMVEPIGTTIGNGERYGFERVDWPTLCFDDQGNAHIGQADDTTAHAVSGNAWLLRGGEVATQDDKPNKPNNAYARTAVGLSADRKTLWLLLVDGKQPRYSEGMTLDELADSLKRHGADEAINLDGGGSVTLARRDAEGRAVLLNRPCHTKIPGRERPVATHLGVRLGGNK